ncbi:5-oxoprolinase subunit B family protein [Micromonospora sp. LOL_021]|uniref:5-oxoprolinase subunit B family protein n=1 Tax=Micromonospora sp. LOL_021 TaxID=3345417 RepID=UPI003A85D145
MRIHPVGRHALLLEWAAPAGTVLPGDSELEDSELGGSERGPVDAWRAELGRRRELGELRVAEIVPGARTILLDGLPDPALTASQLAGWQPAAAEAVNDTGQRITVPVRFDGPDLTDVAGQWGVAVADVVDRLTRIEFTVAFCGFAPGFGYLTGLPRQWEVSRRVTPRPAVPAGSVALAGEHAGIYPTASPGGWQLVGRTDLVLFDLDREPPATLTPGTRVRLTATGPTTPGPAAPQAPAGTGADR